MVFATGICVWKNAIRNDESIIPAGAGWQTYSSIYMTFSSMTNYSEMGIPSRISKARQHEALANIRNGPIRVPFFFSKMRVFDGENEARFVGLKRFVRKSLDIAVDFSNFQPLQYPNLNRIRVIDWKYRRQVRNDRYNAQLNWLL